MNGFRRDIGLNSDGVKLLKIFTCGLRMATGQLGASQGLLGVACDFSGKLTEGTAHLDHHSPTRLSFNKHYFVHLTCQGCARCSRSKAEQQRPGLCPDGAKSRGREFLSWLSGFRTQCCLYGNEGATPGLAQWVKDLALP